MDMQLKRLPRMFSAGLAGYCPQAPLSPPSDEAEKTVALKEKLAKPMPCCE
jgi:hypothetical protein